MLFTSGLSVKRVKREAIGNEPLITNWRKGQIRKGKNFWKLFVLEKFSIKFVHPFQLVKLPKSN